MARHLRGRFTTAQSSRNPKWSPDGRTLAFLSARPEPPGAPVLRKEVYASVWGEKIRRTPGQTTRRCEDGPGLRTAQYPAAASAFAIRPSPRVMCSRITSRTVAALRRRSASRISRCSAVEAFPSTPTPRPR